MLSQKVRRTDNLTVTEPQEHPYPNDATIKELYACAFRCAYPSCSKPLYRLNNDTGDRILNSRVATSMHDAKVARAGSE